MNDEFRFVIPGTSGTDANGNTLGGGSWPYDSRAFSTSGNTEKVITARVATQEEINARRNLALNPFDLRGNDNSRSGANKKSDINVFPHAFANRVTDKKREFEPRNELMDMNITLHMYLFHINHGVVEMKKLIQNFQFYLEDM